MTQKRAEIRLDKWLWQARFFKTRSLCARQIAAGHVRLNDQKISKPATKVGVGDALVFPQARTIRIIRIAALGNRRGPASEAQQLYQDLAPAPAPAQTLPDVANNDRKGRPTKKDRRDLDQMRRMGP